MSTSVREVRILEAYYGTEPQSRRLVLLVGEGEGITAGHHLVHIDLPDMQEWFANHYSDALVTDAGGTGSELNLGAIPPDVLGRYLDDAAARRPSPLPAGLELGCLVDADAFRPSAGLKPGFLEDSDAHFLAYSGRLADWKPGAAVIGGDGRLEIIEDPNS